MNSDDAFYLTNMSQAPFAAGNSKIFRIDEAGRVSIVYEGLTYGVGLTTSPCGETYVTEFATAIPPPAFFSPPGKIVKISPEGEQEVVFDGLTFPSLGRWSKKGLYVSNFSSFSTEENGQILHVIQAEDN